MRGFRRGGGRELAARLSLLSTVGGFICVLCMYVLGQYKALSFSMEGSLKDIPQVVDEQCWVIFWGYLP